MESARATWRTAQVPRDVYAAHGSGKMQTKAPRTSILLASLTLSLLATWSISWFIATRPRRMTPYFAQFHGELKWPSWSPARWPPLHTFMDDQQLTAYESFVGDPAPEMHQLLPRDAEVRYAIKMHSRTWCATELTIMAVRQDRHTPSEFFRIVQTDYGFPFRSVRTQFATDPTSHTRADVHWNLHFFNKTLTVPLTPVFAGMVANTAIYAIPFYYALSVCHRIFRRYRIQRGRCACCGYDLRRLNRCPECGTDRHDSTSIS
ncbi:MAG: hypothetical protein GIKADHBN_03265 [Phycisphaerales bacterium]|nr:hypothetical protein [Phycisphaerales bacterium]